MACRGICRMAVLAVLGLALAAGKVIAQVPGHTPGEFSVDPTGAATYQVPLKVPPGAAGLQPDLALLYHSRAGNGQIGVGWSLSGLSAITRCPSLRDSQGVSHSGGVTLSASDRFCLDGQPLRHQSGTYGANGTLYYTEIQSFQYVRSYGTTNGAPTRFEVTDQAGLKRHYGQTTDSRITSVGVTSGVPIVWALNRIEDKHGNFISFSYGRDATLGEYWPSEIRWSNNASTVLGRVEFSYSTNRNDKTLGYAYGRTRQSLTRRLEYLQVYEGQSTPVRRYVLSYLTFTGGTGVAGSPLSYLYTLRECAGSGSPCLAPTEFLRDVGWRGVNSQAPQTIAGDFGTVQWLDVNGDGRPDGVVFSNGTVRIYFAKDTGAQTQTGVSTGSHLPLQHAVVLDYNGDGLMDLLVPNTNTGYWQLFRSTGTSFVSESTPHLHYGAYNKHPAAFDLSGNGIPELFFRHNGKLWYYRGADAGGFVAGAVATGLTVSAGQRFHALEFNGDGRANLLIDMQGCTTPIFDPDPCPECEPYFVPPDPDGAGSDSLATGDGGVPAGMEPGDGSEGTLQSGSNNQCYQSAAAYGWNPAGGTYGNLTAMYAGTLAFTKPRLLDLDGDGLTDIVGLNSAGNVQAFLNRGGLFEAQWPAFAPGANWDKAVVFDYNLDGRDDVLFPATNGNFQYLTYVNNAVAVGSTFISSQNATYQAADWNGDGLPDLLVRNSGVWRMWPHHGRKEGLLARIRNGLGDEINVRYAALSRADAGYTLYEGHLSSDAPTNTPRVRNFRGPLFVVESFAADTGINTTAGVPQQVVTQYKYAGAKLNYYGRGFLGFRRVTAHNRNTGIEMVNVHFQEFPYTGMVAQAIQKMNDVTTLQFVDPLDCPPQPNECPVPPPVEVNTPGPVVSDTTHTVAQKQLGSGTAQVRFPHVQSSTEKRFELSTGGSLYKSVVTNYTYDSNGNPTQVAATVSNGAGGDVHTVTTVNSYNHSETCPSRLTQSVVTQVAPSAGGYGPLSRQRTATFGYHATHCQLTSEVSHAGTAAALTRTYGYDAFGNRNIETVTGAGISPARTTTWTYDAKGRYLQQTTNPMGHTQAFTWHQGLGVRLGTTDANGLVTSWEYDAFGREQQVIAPRTTQFSTTAWSWCGSSGCQHPEAVLKVTRTGSGGSTEKSLSVTELDRLGREVAAGERNVQGQLVYALTFFDAAGRPYANSGPYRPGLDAGACWTIRHYDSLGRVRDEYASALPGHCGSLAAPPPGARPSGWSRTQTSYNGLTTTVIDPEGRQRQQIVNVMDRLRFAREHDGSAWRQTEYRYDGHGNTTRIADPAGVVTTSVFDTAGRKTSMADPNMGPWTYAYNAAGELTSQTDAKSTTVAMTYDVLGRIKTRSEPEGSTTWTYDNTARGPARGKVTDIAGPHGYRERFWYDTVGGGVRHSARYIGDQWFWTRIDYNALGQVSQIRYPSVDCAAPCSSSPADAARLRVNHYYRYGHLYLVRERLPDGGTGTRYWEALEVDALGSVTREKLGNNLFTQRYVNPATGLVETITTGTSGNATSVQDIAMAWDRVGNLKQRTDYKVNRREDLGYDGLGRLTGIAQKTAAGSSLSSESIQYGPSGNLSAKGAYTGFQYQAQRPHAVSSVTTPSGARNYTYDLNGNLTAVTGAGARTASWWSFNKPRRLERDGSNHSEYWYGPGGERALFRQSARINGQLELTLYGSALYERRIVGTTVEHTHYVQANGATVATIRRTGTSVTNTTRYLHRDHLGSVVAITGETGGITESLAYDAWGKRRPAGTWQTPTPGVFIAAAWQRRGFTMHEHLDHVGLIDMGGRVYDPEIGRFMSPDPFVQFPDSTQGFNRYTYVNNNPLSYTDPSGYFLKKVAKVAGIAMNLVPGMQLNSAWMHGFVSGFLASGGDAKGGLMGMMSAGIASKVGAFADARELGNFSRSALHGITQGAIARAGGGRFGDGALGAFSGSILSFIPEAVAGPYGTGGETAKIGRMLAAAAVGGTASKIGGGKFANGAWSAAFVSRFNHDGGSAQTLLGDNVCSQEGFTCNSLPVQEQLELIGSSTAILGLNESSFRSTAGKFFEAASVLTNGSVSLRLQATLIEVTVDLFHVREVGTVIVSRNGSYFGAYNYRDVPTGRYLEIARGTPYTRNASVMEAVQTNLQRFPTRVNWSVVTGQSIPEASLQRKSW